MKQLKKHLADLTRLSNPKELRLNYLRLDKNENIAALPLKIVDRLRGRITSDFVSAYPDIGPLYGKIAKQIGCPKDHIYIGSGSDAIIKSVFEAFIAPRDKVLLVSPTYAMFYVYVKMFEARLLEVFYEEDLSLSVDEIIRKIRKERPKLICIANPNSPTGTVIAPEGLKRIIHTAQREGSIILIDEAYYLFYNKTCAGLIGK